MKQYVFTILFTATVTFVLAWVVWRLSTKYKLYPGIRERDVHKTPTPRLGGIAMFLGVVAAVLVSSQNDFFAIFWVDPQPILAILLATLIIVLVGVADDLWDLDWTVKLGAQFLAAGIIAWVGKLQILSLPIGGLMVGSSWVSFVLTVFAIVIVMNAVNFIDGLDGLVAGVCLIANAVFFAYSYLLLRDFTTNNFSLATFIAAVLIGSCAGFLPLNWSPAKLFMGDAGALMLGLLMACSAIAITGQLDPAVLDPNDFGRSQLLGAFIPILLPVVVVLLPLLDFGMAVIRRMRAGKSPFAPDRKHLHHRMLDMGHTDRDAVLVFYAWTAIVGLGVLLMYIGTTAGWPGLYLPGIVYLLIGLAACLVVTLPPARRATAPHRVGARHMSPNPVSSTPILRTTLVWSAGVTAVLAVAAAVIGFLVAGTTGLVERAARRADRRGVPRDHGAQHPDRQSLVRRRPLRADLLRDRARRLDPQVRRLHRRAAAPARSALARSDGVLRRRGGQRARFPGGRRRRAHPHAGAARG